MSSGWLLAGAHLWLARQGWGEEWVNHASSPAPTGRRVRDEVSHNDFMPWYYSLSHPPACTHAHAHKHKRQSACLHALACTCMRLHALACSRPQHRWRKVRLTQSKVRQQPTARATMWWPHALPTSKASRIPNTGFVSSCLHALARTCMH